MANRSEWGRGLRESVWNQASGLRPMGRNALALDDARLASGARQREESGEGAASVLRFFAAPWIAPVRHRYRSGSQWLMGALEWVTAKTWPLAALDDMCEWFEQGSGASRMFVGGWTAAVLTVLLTVHATALLGLQALMLLPVFGGHGMLALVAASFVVGATVLPAVLGLAIGVLLRFYVLANLCVLAALVGYGGWLLYSYAKF